MQIAQNEFLIMLTLLMNVNHRTGFLSTQPNCTQIEVAVGIMMLSPTILRVLIRETLESLGECRHSFSIEKKFAKESFCAFR